MEGIIVVVIMVLIGYVLNEFSKESSFYRDVNKMIDENAKRRKELTKEFFDNLENKK